MPVPAGPAAAVLPMVFLDSGVGHPTNTYRSRRERSPGLEAWVKNVIELSPYDNPVSAISFATLERHHPWVFL